MHNNRLTKFNVNCGNSTVSVCCSLRPYSQYQFRIAASNDVGISNFSEPTPAVRTLEAAPGSPPVSVSARTLSTTSVLVSWMVSLVIYLHVEFISFNLFMFMLV